MYKKLLLTTAVLCSLNSVAMAKDLVSIDGTYQCSVTVMGGEKAHSTGKFSLATQGNVYAVTQLKTDGAQPVPNEYRIFAMRSGNVLSMAYQNVKDASTFGLEMMKISKDGKTLNGTFVYWDQFDKKNIEVCKRV